MAEENGHANSKAVHDEDVGQEKPCTDGSNEAGKDGNGGDQKKKKKEPPPPTVKAWELFKFADKWDVLLMIVGTLGAICLGASMPLIALLFGQLMDSFGKNTGDPDELASSVTTVSDLEALIRLARVQTCHSADEGCFFLQKCAARRRLLQATSAVSMRTDLFHSEIKWVDSI